MLFISILSQIKGGGYWKCLFWLPSHFFLRNYLARWKFFFKLTFRSSDPISRTLVGKSSITIDRNHEPRRFATPVSDIFAEHYRSARRHRRLMTLLHSESVLTRSSVLASRARSAVAVSIQGGAEWLFNAKRDGASPRERGWGGTEWISGTRRGTPPPGGPTDDLDNSPPPPLTPLAPQGYCPVTAVDKLGQ